jgi:tetratricopeptide (TPR) repeat protein
MAAIEADAEKLDEALQLFAEADQYISNDINFTVDYARCVATASTALNDEKLRKDAFERFEHIYQIAPQNTRNLKNWAVLLMSLGKYAEAWEKIKLAEATPDKKLLDPKLISDLESHMPRPQ